MTILRQTFGNGAKTRRCDATCHYAKHEKCACICGGRYHGKQGLAAALLARDWVGDSFDAAKAEASTGGGALDVSYVVRDALNQMSLPLDGVM